MLKQNKSLSAVVVCFAVTCQLFMVPDFSLAATVTGTASAEIRQAIAVVQTSALNFGAISALQSDTITITPSGSISSQNGAKTEQGNASSGHFNAGGNPNTNVIISFTGGSLTGAGTPMEINNLTHDSGATPRFDGNGILSFQVGADLVINNDQATGLYTGTYEVSVNYQ